MSFPIDSVINDELRVFEDEGKEKGHGIIYDDLSKADNENR